MAATFNERVSEELDALWAAGLFLADGDAGAAEAVLTRAVLHARREWWRSDAVPRGELGRILRSRLALAASRRGDRPAGGDRAAASELVGRAALWLVVVERWRYAEAARALDVTGAELRVLLDRQQSRMRALQRSLQGGEGGAEARPEPATGLEGVG